MKILYISQFFYPEITAAAFRAYEHCEVWSREDGIDLTVYTGNPNYPKGELYDGYKNQMIEIDMSNEYRIVRSKSIIKKNTTKIGRLIVTLSFLLVGIFNLIFHRKKIGKKFDVVLGTSGPIFAGLLAYLYALCYRAHFIFEIRDITYIQMIATMSKQNSVVVKVMKYLELFLCKRAQKVVVVTQGFKDELIKQGIKEEKIEVIYNGVKVKEYPVYQEEKSGERLILTYAGTIGISQDIEELVDFFKQLDCDNKQLNIIGEGAQKAKLIEYLKEHKIKNVTLYDAMVGDAFDQMLHETTFAIVKLKYDEHFKGTIPSKLFDLMNRGIPILYLGPEGETSYHINESQSGITLTTMDNKKNVLIFENLLGEIKLSNFSKNGILYLRKYFDRTQLASRYLEQFYHIHWMKDKALRKEETHEYNQASNQ